MTLENIDGIKVFIIESLRNGDKKTGEDLKDNLRQIWYDQNLISDFDCQYTYVHDSNDLICTIMDIEKQVKYLQPIITQYFIDNKSEIWLLFLIAHSKR